VAQRFQRCDKSISLDAGPAGNKHPNYDIPKLELDQPPDRFSLDLTFHFR
jgi:hypothetical protein